jgi:hypothetical protein
MLNGHRTDRHTRALAVSAILFVGVVGVTGCGGGSSSGKPLAARVPRDGRTISIEVPDGWLSARCTDPGPTAKKLCGDSTEFLAVAQRKAPAECETGLYFNPNSESPEYDNDFYKYFGSHERGWLIADLHPGDAGCEEGEVQVPTSDGRVDVTLVVRKGVFNRGQFMALMETVKLK